MLEARTVETKDGGYVKDDKYINGMPEYTVEIKEHLSVNLRSNRTFRALCSSYKTHVTVFFFMSHMSNNVPTAAGKHSGEAGGSDH